MSQAILHAGYSKNRSRSRSKSRIRKRDKSKNWSKIRLTFVSFIGILYGHDFFLSKKKRQNSYEHKITFYVNIPLN